MQGDGARGSQFRWPADPHGANDSHMTRGGSRLLLGFSWGKPKKPISVCTQLTVKKKRGRPRPPASLLLLRISPHPNNLPHPPQWHQLPIRSLDPLSVSIDGMEVPPSSVSGWAVDLWDSSPGACSECPWRATQPDLSPLA